MPASKEKSNAPTANAPACESLIGELTEVSTKMCSVMIIFPEAGHSWPKQSVFIPCLFEEEELENEAGRISFPKHPALPHHLLCHANLNYQHFPFLFSIRQNTVMITKRLAKLGAEADTGRWRCWRHGEQEVEAMKAGSDEEARRHASVLSSAGYKM